MEPLEEYLHHAIINNDIHNVSILLSKGANPNTLTFDGATCLCEAALIGNIDILNLLISASSNRSSIVDIAPEDCDRKHSRKGHKRKCKWDGQNGGSTTKCKNLNDSKESDLSESKELYRNRGYFVFIHSEASSSDDGRIPGLRSPLSPASLSPSSQADLEWDEEIGNIAPTTSEDETWTALYKWYASILESSGPYLAAGPIVNNGINQQDGFSRNALHYAVESGHNSVVKLLLHAGIKPDVADNEGVTPLHIAVLRNELEILELLIKAGANVNNVTHRKKVAPLHFASKKGMLNLVKCLVQFGANLELRDSNDFTALYHAVRYKHLDVVKYLTSCGANVNVETIWGRNPLFYAVMHEDTAMVQVLLNHGARIIHTHELLHMSIENKQEDMLKLLAQHGGGVNLHSGHGDTPLLTATRLSQPHLAKILLDSGANVNITNSVTGSSALHMAVNNVDDDKFEDLLKLFIEHNIDLDIVSFLIGDTALSRAITSERDSLAALLICHGADVNIVDLQVGLVENLCYASKRKTNNLASMLIKAGHHAVQLDPMTIEDTDCVAQWVFNACANPLNLSDICRIRIRGMCRSRQLFKYIDNLPLPGGLKRFLKMENEDYPEDPHSRGI